MIPCACVEYFTFIEVDNTLRFSIKLEQKPIIGGHLGGGRGGNRPPNTIEDNGL